MEDYLKKEKRCTYQIKETNSVQGGNISLPGEKV